MIVEEGSAADGRTVDQVADTASDPGHADDIWFSMLVRDQAIVAARGNTQLKAGDEVLVTADNRWHGRLKELFSR